MGQSLAIRNRALTASRFSVLWALFFAVALPFSDGHAKAQSASTATPSIEVHLKPANSAVKESYDQATRIRVDSDLVLIPVSVTGHDGSTVLGLEKESFRLYEDKVEQEISHFGMEDAPASLGLLFDSSASMDDKLLKAREAVVSFLDASRADDEFFLVQFNNHVDLTVAFTKQTEEIERQLKYVRPFGQTAVLDATIYSIQQMQDARYERKALIIISDGGDNCSRYTMSELKRLVRESAVQIYVMGIFEPLDSRPRSLEEIEGPALLKKIAEQSGGRLFEIRNVDQLPAVAAQIGEALRQQYVLAYRPSNRRRDGKYHHVEVKLVHKHGSPKLRAFWRRGYYAPVD